jgi:hypothetical protein
MKLQIFPWLMLAILSTAPLVAAQAAPQDPETAAVAPLPQVPSSRAVVDMRFACEWLADSYEIPARVPQEMFLAGFSYSDAMIALGLMHKGASLNELLELRRQMRWLEVAERVEIDPQTLPGPLRGLLQLGVTFHKPKLLHYLPDVYSGLKRDLTINAFPPTVPTSTMVERFRLDEDEVRNIRRALDDPFGVPEDLLLETAGKGALVVGDWVLAGVLVHNKPMPMESVLGARGGQQLSWSEICLAYGFRPDVLTRGPLTGIYPVLTGSTPGTVLCARKRKRFPEEMPLRYELYRLTVDEKMALRPLMLHAYKASASEDQLLMQGNLFLAEQGIALQLARMSQLDLSQILQYRKSGLSWAQIPAKLQLDLTGEDAFWLAMEHYSQ